MNNFLPTCPQHVATIVNDGQKIESDLKDQLISM